MTLSPMCAVRSLPRLLAPIVALVVLGAASGLARAAGPVAEVRLGLLWPDIGPPDSRLPGVDANAEVLFTSPMAGVTTNLPAWLRWAVTPQINVGGTVNTSVSAQQAYAGLTWTVPLASNLLHQDDGLTLGFSLGPAVLGGSALPSALDTGVKLRLGAEIGYQVTPRFGLYVLFDHVGATGTASANDSLNDVGVRVGLRF